MDRVCSETTPIPSQTTDPSAETFFRRLIGCFFSATVNCCMSKRIHCQDARNSTQGSHQLFTTREFSRLYNQSHYDFVDLTTAHCLDEAST
jgi:hypothetical protein